MAAQVLIHRHDQTVIGPVWACINFGCMIDCCWAVIFGSSRLSEPKKSKMLD